MRMPRAAVMLSWVMLTLVSGCAQGPPPRVWAASVCSSLDPWRAEIATLTARAQQLTPQSVTPEQARENLVRMLSGATDASERARAQVAAAGVPGVEGGPEVAAAMVESLRKIRDAYGNARDTVQGLPTNDADAFYDAVADAMVTLQREYQASELDTSALSSAELEAAFAEVPECR